MTQCSKKPRCSLCILDLLLIIYVIVFVLALKLHMLMLLSPPVSFLSSDVLIRPSDIVCRRTYILPVFLILSFFLSFVLYLFFRPLISEVAERNSTKIGDMVGSKCNLKTHVRNLGHPFPLQIGGPKTTFLGRLRNLRATLTAYIYGMKRDIDNRSSALTTTRGLIHCPKMS